MFLATLDAGQFHFTVIERDEDTARDAIMAAWDRHVAITRADPNYVDRTSINVAPIAPGVVLRDGSPFVMPAPRLCA